MIRIESGDLSDRRVIDLLTTHVTRARRETAPGSAHALDVERLRSPGITFWAAIDNDGTLLGVAALQELSPDHGEVKSMHTAESARRRGVGSLLLRYVIEIARARGMGRVSLETGSWPYFDPARAFYRRHGFVECGAFGDYVDDPNSVFFSMELK
jgi:putative acetyltransferase